MNFTITNKGVQVFGRLTGGIFGSGATAAAGAASSAVNSLPTIFDNGQIVAAINALRTFNWRALAKPTLVALNGQSASLPAPSGRPWNCGRGRRWRWRDAARSGCPLANQVLRRIIPPIGWAAAAA